jgi:antitoxin (DNA-binding transcriptional repressor) of toxin-antitoxin stability system
MHEAKTHLSSLVKDAVNGTPFIIANAGRPMVTVSAYRENSTPQNRVGFLKGQLVVPKDFDRMGSDEIASLFDGAEGKK